MKICSITPVPHIKWSFKNSSMVMVLTHLVEKYPRYVEEINSHHETYKILDNSLIELDGALSMSRLVKAADKIKAHEIILPDVFKNGKETVKSAIESIRWLKQHKILGKYNLMAVCHGRTRKEFEECFNALNSMPEIDVIGIPKVMSSMSWVKNRNRASLYPIFKHTKKEIHFLGSWYQLGELVDMPTKVFKFVRSCDTCLPFLDCVQHKGIYEDRNGTINLEENYFLVTEKEYDELMQTLNEELNIKHHITKKSNLILGLFRFSRKSRRK